MIINNEVENNTVNMYSGILKFSRSELDGNISEGNFSNSVDFNFYSGTLDFNDQYIKNTNLGNLNLYGDMNIILDVDIKTHTSDTIGVNSFLNSDNHSINVLEICPKNSCTDVSFNVCPFDNSMPDDLKKSLANSLKYSGKSKVETPIYEYNVEYEPEKRVFHFYRDVIAGGQRFSSSVMASSVGAQLGGYLVQLNSYEEAFRNMDKYMMLPKSQRLNLELKNKYAGNNLNYYPNDENKLYANKNIWFKPYTVLEKVPIGMNVSNALYGTFFGEESELIHLKKGFKYIYSPYIGYNGSRQSYDNVSIYQNGGTLGGVMMFYKENFFTGLTFNVSSNGAEAHTKFGSENFNMVMAGVATKTGYNFEFKEGKFIIQPNCLLSYTFVNTSDYKSASNLDIQSKPLNAIQVAPGIQLIANLKNDLKIYLGVNVMFNIIDRTRFKANDITLPYLAIKPYVMYGGGFQKRFKDRFCGFMQAYVTSGGRNGIGLSLGLSCELGR